MAGRPRTRRDEGLDPHPWRDDPALSTRPPFTAGNTAAETHGATSPRRVSPLAERYADRLPTVAPWVDRGAFDGAVRSYCWIEAQLSLLRAYVDEAGTLDDEGKPRPACALADRLEARAATLRSELGLTPQALARLLGTLTGIAVAGGDEDGLAALKREGAGILAARRLAVVDGDGAAS